MTRLPLALVAVALLALGLLSLPAPPVSGAHSGAIECPYSDQLTVVDGAVVPGEYADAYTDPDTGITASFQYNGDTMAVGLESPGQGWVAIAFGTVLPGTNYTNVIIAYVNSSGAVISVDQVDHGWERHWDTSIGGTDDIARIAGTRDASGTTVEFHFPLNSSDANDHHFEPEGTYTFLLAYSAMSSDFNSSDTAHSQPALVQVGRRPDIIPPEGTRILVGLPSRIVPEESATLTAVLRNASGVGLSGQTLTFEIATTFGALVLGEATTSNAGRAVIEWTPRAAGTWTLTVRFAGQGKFLPAAATAEVLVEEPDPAPPPLLRVDTGIALIVIAVVGSIWATYGFVAYQLTAIRAEGLGRPPPAAVFPRLRSRQAKAGEKDD